MSGGPRLRQDDHLSALQPGARLHSYTVGAMLGAGGFGITYKAVEDITNREVAIKEYLPTAYAVRDRDGTTVRPLSEGAARDFEWGLERFREEAKLLIGFRHPNIVPVLAYFEANGTGYLVMAFQDGTSLAEMLRGAPTLSEAQVLQFMRPLIDGVEEVHRRGFLHRDIKPENIFIRGDGTPVLLDFGAARQALGEHSKILTTLLTEGYAPFEQYAGSGNQGPWSDIYALAAVMFRCLAGKPPVEAPRRAIAKLRGLPDPMAHDFAELRGRVSSDLAFAIEAAMRVVEQERPQSIAALRELVSSPAPAALRMPAASPRPTRPTTPYATTLVPDAEQAGAARHPPPWATAERRKPRRTIRYLAFGAVALAAASGAAYVGDQRNWLPEAFRRAGPESTAATPAHAGPSDADARRQAEAARRRVEDKPRQSEQQRQADEKRRAEQQAEEQQRNQGLFEYQRLQLEAIEAERRQYLERRSAEERRKAAEPGAPPAKPDNAARRTAPERASPDPRSDQPRDREAGPADPRRQAMPAAPPSWRRGQHPDEHFDTPAPPTRGPVPRGWQEGDDDY